MTKNIILLLLISLITFGCKTNKEKQTKNQDSTQTPSKQPEVQEYYFPEEFVYNNSEYVLVDQFYPIGWSDNGKFAYIIEPADEAVGAYMVRYIIKDLVNNKIIWEWENEPDPENSENETRQTIWEKKYPTLKRRLNQYHIKQQKHFDTQPAYFKYKGESYALNLTKTTKKAYEDLEIVTGYTVSIKSPDKGSKLVYQEKFTPYDMILNVVLKGCFISPYEKRIAILIATERRGYEGPPNVISLTIVGTNLETGFQK